MSNYDDIKSLIKSFSGTERHITIPKVYLELLGDFNTAALLNQLIFWSDKTKRSDGFFYRTYTEWEDELLLSEYQVRRSVKMLKEKGLVDTKIKRANGSPTVHYKVNMRVLSESILKKLKNRNLSNLRNDTKETKGTLTVDDTVDDNSRYLKSSDSTVHPYKEIIEHLNDKTNKQYKHTTKKTQALIKARFNEGFELGDFKSVIDTKSKEWINTDMEKYLRPETLFGTKFESYLNQMDKAESSEYDPLWD